MPPQYLSPGASPSWVTATRPHCYQQGAAPGCAVSRGKAGANPRAQWGESARVDGAGSAGRAVLPTGTAVPPHEGGPMALCCPGGLHTSQGRWDTWLGELGRAEPPILIPAPHSSASARGVSAPGFPCPHTGWQH